MTLYKYFVLQFLFSALKNLARLRDAKAQLGFFYPSYRALGAKFCLHNWGRRPSPQTVSSGGDRPNRPFPRKSATGFGATGNGELRIVEAGEHNLDISNFFRTVCTML